MRWGAAVLLSYVACLSFWKLDVFPALHGDEAWVGLFALRLKERGFYTPHEMNTYTGAFYGWLVSLWFKYFSANVFYLRITSALGNFLAAAAMAGFLGRRFGARAAFVWLYLSASSALYVHATHVAWEVCALQNLMLACVYVSAAEILENKKPAKWAIGLFLAANYFGVWNHFIFLSVPMSLLLYAFSREVFFGKPKDSSLLEASAAAMFLTAAVFFIKPLWTEDNWPLHKELYLSSVVLAPFAAAAVFSRLKPALRSVADLFVSYASKPSRRERYGRALALSFAVFLMFHAAPMVQILSNVVVFKRTASWAVPWFIAFPLYAWAAWLFSVCFRHAYARLKPKAFSALKPSEAFVLFWPFAYAAVYTLFRHTSSIRYYFIPSFLFLACAGYVFSRRRESAKVLCAAAAAGLFFGFCFFTETASPGIRRPIKFRIGWRKEKSADFLSKKPVYDFMEANRICRLDQDESMLDIPIMFHRQSSQYACDYAQSIHVGYCWNCEKPPFFKWTVRSTESP